MVRLDEPRVGRRNRNGRATEAARPASIRPDETIRVAPLRGSTVRLQSPTRIASRKGLVAVANSNLSVSFRVSAHLLSDDATYAVVRIVN